MSRQSEWNPVRPGCTDELGRTRKFFVGRIKELAYGGLFSTIFLLSQSPLHALVIDDIRVLSKLGEPLRAEVRVLTSAGERLTQGCFSSVSGTGDLPAIGAVRLTLSRQLDTQILRVTGRQPIREPMSEFVLQVRCAGSPTVVRSFLVMVDPPGMVASTPAPLAEQQVAITTPAPFAQQPAAAAQAAGQAIPRLRARSGGTAIVPGSRYLVQNGDMLSMIASRVSGRPNWSVWPIAQQIYNANPGAFLMGDPNRIAQGSTIYIPRLDQIDFSVQRESVTPVANPAPAPTTATAPDTAPSPADIAPEVPVVARITPAPARIAPAPQVAALATTPLQAMQLTVALGDESRMKLRLRRQGTPVVDTNTEPEVPAAATDPQPVPTTQPEIPDAAATPRVALPPQTAGTGWFGWLGIGVGLLLAFLLGALVAGYALRRRLERQNEAQPEDATRPGETAPAAVAVPPVAIPSPLAEPPQGAGTIEVSEEPVHASLDLERPAHTTEVSTLPELDLELPHDEPTRVGEPARVGAPETLEMPQANDSVDFELTPHVDTGRTGQHEVDFDLLEKAYSEDYVAQFIEPLQDQAQASDDRADGDVDANANMESPPTGETAQYYHLENRDPADDAPLPIELGEDEMSGESDDDHKIVNFPKSTSTSTG